MMTTNPFGVDPVQLFGDYMKVTGVPSLAPAQGPDPRLSGKKLGVVNGSSWVSLWSTYFGRLMLPGVKIVNVGNEAVQLNFMDAHHRGRPCPPQINIDLFCRYARDVFDLVGVDAILISCSTMNRAFRQVREHMQAVGVPVVQIDEAMMEEAVTTGGRILVIATHGPTVKSTQSLLQETAARLGRSVDFVGATVEDAFDLLGQGRIAEHNALIDRTILSVQKEQPIDIVVLAQLSMSVFSFYRPDPVAAYGIPVLNSGQTGFRRAGEVLAAGRVD
ncbi:MAG: aspartate/glutamate racemase family protein [Planctomycetes bacterium]|jgi:Asp/Glu/hydantoin racemase|nr:aspartate/glutamate racemase family protein [Planctomycetota bacterium]